MPDHAIERLLLQQEIAEFLHHEADLLDDGRYEDWLDLLTDDVSYVMPLRLNVALAELPARGLTRPGAEVCWFDEGKDTLRKRVQQLATGVHWAEEPRSRVSHLVTNIRLVAVTPTEVEVSCRFVVHRNRVAAETDFFVGRRRDTLRRVDGDGDDDGDGGGDGRTRWRLCRRELLLDQNVLTAKNLTLLF
ncbi:MAG: 3-phenylpropionate/cinnamic acid dioxygenase subunit beta [Acidimicrobiales bacterium]